MVGTKPKIKPKKRLSFEDRRQAILEAAIPLFVEQGFQNVTTRELARQAGVSEALLYQHFPSKEALYAEVESVLCTRMPSLQSLHDRLDQAEPSSETLVMVLYLFARLVIAPPRQDDSMPLFPRLILQSLLEGGEFARIHAERGIGRLASLIAGSLEAARQAGDLAPDPMADHGSDMLKFWFAHHVMAMIHFFGNMTEKPVIDYGVERVRLVDHAMIFALRGMGFRQDVIKRLYRPDQFCHFFPFLKDDWGQDPSPSSGYPPFSRAED